MSGGVWLRKEPILPDSDVDPKSRRLWGLSHFVFFANPASFYLLQFSLTAPVRKRQKRPTNACYAPLLLAFDTIAIKHRAAGDLIIRGAGSMDSWDTLANCYNLLSIGAYRRSDADLHRACKEVYGALESIRARAGETDPVAANDEESELIRILLSLSEDFWRRQGSQFYNNCILHMKRTLRS